MKLRLIGKKELIETIVKVFNLQVKLYPDRRNTNNYRIYLDLDDNAVIQKMQQIETAITIINEQ